MKILITGVSGFIGSYLANFFLSKGCKVWSLSRTENKKIKHEHFQWIQSDLAKEIPTLDKIDYCIHGAALSPAPGLQTIDFIQNNVLGTYHLIEALKLLASCKRLFFLSGVSVYGQVEQAIIDEESPSINPDDYGISKLFAERLIEDQEDLPVTILRLPGVLGPSARTPWLVRQIHRALKNELIKVYNPDALFNNAVWIADLAKFVEKLIENHDRFSKDLLLLGAKEPISIKGIIKIIIQETNSSSRTEFIKGSPSFQINVSKSIKYGYEPRTIKEMLGDQIALEKNNFYVNH